jgi:anthrone oxygenase-like protein
MNYSDLALGASNLLLGTAVGAGVNQSIFVMPKWFTSPPQSIAKAQAEAPFKSFWIPLQAASALALSGAFALNRRNDERRKFLSLALGFYVGTFASTAAYFAPEIIRLSRAGDEMAASEAARRAKRWQRLNWARLLALGAAWALTAAALARKKRRFAL